MTTTTAEHIGDVPDDIMYRFTIISRGEFDDFTEPVECAGCKGQCGGDTRKVPISYAVMHVGTDGENRPICEACTRAMGAGPMWDLAAALDRLDHEFVKAPSKNWLLALVAHTEYLINEDIDTWRRIGRTS